MSTPWYFPDDACCAKSVELREEAFVAQRVADNAEKRTAYEARKTARKKWKALEEEMRDLWSIYRTDNL